MLGSAQPPLLARLQIYSAQGNVSFERCRRGAVQAIAIGADTAVIRREQGMCGTKRWDSQSCRRLWWPGAKPGGSRLPGLGASAGSTVLPAAGFHLLFLRARLARQPAAERSWRRLRGLLGGLLTEPRSRGGSVPREAARDAEGQGFRVRGVSHRGLKEIKYLLLQNWRFG